MKIRLPKGRVAPVLEQAPAAPAWHPWVILLTVPLVLTPWWYFGRFPFYYRAVHAVAPDGPFKAIYPMIWFGGSSLLLRLVVPVLLIKLVLREPLSRYGFRLRGTFDLWYVYLGLFLVMLPILWLASAGPGFQRTYPQCRAAIDAASMTIPWAQFMVYQGFYFLLFVGGESFWRGYLAFGLFRSIRWLSLPVMIIPYVMIHYGKPFPEAMTAGIAGLVLGFLALRHGNFWLGVLLHYGIALTMDVMAMVRQGISLV